MAVSKLWSVKVRLAQVIDYATNPEKTSVGELEYYEKSSYFEKHLNGSLYYENVWHDVEFFAFVHADAYDTMLYNASLGNENMQEYLRYVKKKAINYKELSFDVEERFVTLSTCTSGSTNGRRGKRKIDSTSNCRKE